MSWLAHGQHFVDRDAGGRDVAMPTVHAVLCTDTPDVRLHRTALRLRPRLANRPPFEMTWTINLKRGELRA